MDDGAKGAGDGEGAALGLGLQGYLGDKGAQDGHGIVDGLGMGELGAQVLDHGLVVLGKIWWQGDCGLLWRCGLGCQLGQGCLTSAPMEQFCVIA